MTAELPLLVGRAIEAHTGLARAHFQARRELPRDFWRPLHALFALAEARNLLDLPIQRDNPKSVTCRELYLRIMLAFIAMPYNLLPRELELALRWIWRWSHKVQIVTTHERDGFFGVDLAEDAPPRWMKAVRGPAIRQFDMGELRRSVRKRIKGIEGGVTPQDLGLGPDLSPAEATPLLTNLHKRWFETPVARHAPRHAGAVTLQLAVTFEEIYNALAGPRPIGPKHLWGRVAAPRDEVFVLGRLNAATTACVFPPRLEHWEQLDFSTSGLRLRRVAAGERIAFRQLAAVCESATRGFVLSEVRWVTEGADHSVIAAMQLMPGLPQPIGVRGARAGIDPGANTAAFQPAFMLPAAAGAAPSLILAYGAFKPAQSIELYHANSFYLARVGELVERGADYERYRFERGEPLPLESTKPVRSRFTD